MQNISIILVEPQMGENIGSIARVMKNFGLHDLRIFAPRDGWPNQKALNTSVGAINIIKNARIFASVNNAISDLDFIYATTGTPRDMNKNYILTNQLFNDILVGSKVGIMFGRESSGLTNEEIALANKILVIDTDRSFSSLNISHAASVICYELFSSNLKHRNDLRNSQKLASKKELNHFYEHLFFKLEENKFFKTIKKKDHMSFKIRNLFARIDNISKSEVQTLHGIIKMLSKEKNL